MNTTQQEIDIDIPVKKIYKDNAVFTASFLGGPLAATYIIAENFKAFNEPEKAKKTWVYGILSTIVIFAIAFFAPFPKNFPSITIPLIYTTIASQLAKHFQGRQIKEHLEAGGGVFRWRRTLVVVLIGLATILIAATIFVLLFPGL